MNDHRSNETGHTPAPDEIVTRRPARKRTVWFALAACAVALLAAGIVPRLQATSALAAQTKTSETLTVSVIHPTQAPTQQELLLPGAVSAYSDASVYARVSGYIAKWQTDIGAQVKAGQILATVEAPELDAQLRQARADAETARANYLYAKSTAARWQQMLSSQSVSQQDASTKTADMQAKQAALDASNANVAHLAQLVSYEQIRAPFDGTVTARNVDVGTLVTAGGTPGSAGAGGELFHVSQTRTLRVFVDVPQDDAPFVDDTTRVYLTTPQYPGRQLAARVVRNTGSINATSRTLRVEVDFDNAQHVLMPGAYAQVHLALASVRPALDLPVSALLFRPDGITVAVVNASGVTELKTVHVGRDFGTHMEITQGVAATDRVIDNPGDAITAGQPVQVQQAGAASAGQPAHG